MALYESVHTKPGNTGEKMETGRFGLQLGGREYLVEGVPVEWEHLLPPRLLACKVPALAGSPERVISLQLSAQDHLRPVHDSETYKELTQLSFEAGRVMLKADWCEGVFPVAAHSQATFQVHTDAAPWFGGLLENLLRVLMAYDILNSGGVMMHCAAIVKQARAAVMFGHSGAGKSTTSALALAEGCSVISDDINIIEPGPTGWQVTPVPFSGTLNAMSDITRPVNLHGLFRLFKSDADRLQECSAARSVSLLAGSAPFVNQDSHRSAQLLDILTNLAADVPVRDLYFTNSSRFLKNVF